MGVTAIKRILNNFSSPITVTMTDHENTGLQPVQVSQNTMADCDMWIPWCTSQTDFNNNHYITITGPNVQYYIWQAAHSDGDFVRFSTTGYQDPGQQIPNISQVNGDRCIAIDEHGISLWVFGGSVQIPWFPSSLLTLHSNWHMNPPSQGGRKFPQGQPGSGAEFLTFHCTFLDQFHAWYNSQSFANQALVTPWTQFPASFRQVQDGPGRFNDVKAFLNQPTLWGQTDDALGISIEGSIHSWLHMTAVAQAFNDPVITDFMTAANSSYFYQLHGLINYWWTYWQNAVAPKGWVMQHCSPLPALNAIYVSQSVPSSVTANSTFSATVTMQNTGTSTWTPGGSNPFRLGAQNPQDNTTWGRNRMDVPSAIAPGSQVTFNLTLTAPAVSGTYNFQWRMVEELISWFGDFTPNVSITVTGGKGKEHKDKDGKAEKDGKDRKDRDIVGTFGLAGPSQNVEESDPGTAQGQSFINSDERPAVGGQAFTQADEA